MATTAARYRKKITNMQQGMPLSANPSQSAMVLGALQPKQALVQSHAAGLTGWPTPPSGEPGRQGQEASTRLRGAHTQAALSWAVGAYPETQSA